MSKRDNPAPLLAVRQVTKSYRRSWFSSSRAEVQALRGVDLELRAGESLAIVGPSGSGKSTLARCIAGLEQPTSGKILWEGRELDPETAHQRIQLIFQDPGASLNPRFAVAEALAEPLAVHRTSWSRNDILRELRQVGLPETAAERRTSQLSGGQKARLALARALGALDDGGPSVLILDESLASLDLSVQAQIINLLVDLQARRSLAYILIAHDLALALHLADEVAVMFQGRIVERGTPQSLLATSGHPHWHELLAATPTLEPGRGQRDV